MIRIQRGVDGLLNAHARYLLRPISVDLSAALAVYANERGEWMTIRYCLLPALGVGRNRE